MVDENRFEGTVKNLGGKLEGAVGGLTGDASTEAQGKADQAVGKAQDMYGQVVDGVKNLASANPVATLLSAMGVGVVLGFFLRRR